MALDRISLTRFRNHAETRLEGAGQLNLLVGENGAGKTNVLEALSLLAPGRGLRRAALTEMARAGGAGGFAISAELATGAGEPVRLGTGISAERPGRRIVRIAGAEASAIALGEWLALSWLTPAMDGLFADSPGARRRFLDRLTVALDPAHARNCVRYEAALRERNRLLTSDGLGEAEANPAWFDSLEMQLAEAGALVAAARARLVERLGAALADQPDQPFARPALAYVPGGPLEQEALARAFAAGRARDRAAQRTLDGPHRDELAVTMASSRAGTGEGSGAPAAQCSTGEQKALLIAITLAHAELAAGERPDNQPDSRPDNRPGVLLLDEVAAHLDPVRREALFERLAAGRAQVWLTGTELAPFAPVTDTAAIWRVARGAAERL